MEVRRRVVAGSTPPIVGTTGARFPSARQQRRWLAETPTSTEPAATEPAATEPAATEPVDGQPAGGPEKPLRQRRARGARFPSEAMLRRWEAEDAASPVDVPPAADADRAVEGQRSPSLPAPDRPADDGPKTAMVRPYVLTSGRARPVGYLGLETLVSRLASPRPRRPLPDAVHRAVVELCGRPRSVAEVAAMLAVPLGVARVLIGDLSRSGILMVHRAPTRDGSPDRELMSRVLDGLRRI